MSHVVFISEVLLLVVWCWGLEESHSWWFGTAGAPGAFLSLPVLFLHVAASDSWTSSVVVEGSWSHCPKRDRQDLPGLESYTQLH